MSAFPLLILPPDTLQTLLNYYGTDELFQLSQCSRRAEGHVKTFTATLLPSFHLFIITGHMTEVHLLSPDYTSGIKLSLYGERSAKRLNLQFPEVYNFDGLRIDLCREAPDDRMQCFGSATTHSTADVFKFSQHLLTVFNTKIDDLSVEVDDSMEPVLMSKYIQMSVNTLIKGGVTHEEMVQVLELCTGAGGMMHVGCSPDQHFVYDKTISGNALSINSAKWIKRHNLLKLDSEYVDITDCHLENEDLNAFLRHWLQSGDKKLKVMSIRSKFCSSDEEKENAYKFVQEEVLKGLPTIPGAPKRQDAISALRNMFLHTDVPFESGMDLRRESDGVLATVVVRDDGYGVVFTFVVWQEPNPNVVVVVP